MTRHPTIELQVPALTVFAFSSENWTRGADEVAFLMDLFSQSLRSEGEAMHDRGIRLRVVGSREQLPGHLRDEVLR
jgi:undecaprenyl diphosphate synthase